MKAQAFSIDLLVSVSLLLILLSLTFFWRYEDVGHIKAYDFAAIVHKSNFTNVTFLSNLENEYNISIHVSCPNFTYAGSGAGEIFVERVAWYNGELCNISVGV